VWNAKNKSLSGLIDSVNFYYRHVYKLGPVIQQNPPSHRSDIQKFTMFTALFILGSLQILMTLQIFVAPPNIRLSNPQQQRKRDSPAPALESFDWSLSQPYSIVGPLRQQILTSTNQLIFALPPGQARLINDPTNQRMFFDLSSTGGPVYYVTQNGSYVAGEQHPYFQGHCAFVPGWTYARQVEAYKSLGAAPGNSASNKAYSGLSGDVGACNHDIGVLLTTQSGPASNFHFAQRIPFPVEAAPNFFVDICVLVRGVWEFDRATLDTTGNWNSVFTLPTQCQSNVVDYCSTLYPAGNPCIVSP
jgi:hypothetical protein